jgi:hypothetical protein
MAPFYGAEWHHGAALTMVDTANSKNLKENAELPLLNGVKLIL